MSEFFSTKIALASGAASGEESAFRAAADLASKTSSELHVVHAWSSSRARSDETREREAREFLFERLDEIERLGGASAGAHLGRGDAPKVVSSMAEVLDAGIIVVGGERSGGLRRLVFGSVVEGIIARTARPVLVCRSGVVWPPTRVIVGDDSSASAKRAVELGSRVTSLLAIPLTLTRALPLFRDVTEAEKDPELSAAPLSVSLHRHETLLQSRVRTLSENFDRNDGVRVREGEASSVILESAEDDRESSLIVVGRRGLGRFDDFMLGSVSRRIIRRSVGAVLVCPDGPSRSLSPLS